VIGNAIAPSLEEALGRLFLLRRDFRRSGVANIKTGQIVSANIADHPAGEPGLLHGIGWTPDESEVWESSSSSDPHIYIWSMLDPMAPKLKQKLSLRRGSHWLKFDLKGDYAYVAPNKNSDDGTEIFNARTHTCALA
jgi:hypothetical protein